MSILIANLIFWALWLGLSYLPQYITQKVIDNHTNA